MSLISVRTALGQIGSGGFRDDARGLKCALPSKWVMLTGSALAEGQAFQTGNTTVIGGFSKTAGEWIHPITLVFEQPFNPEKLTAPKLEKLLNAVPLDSISGLRSRPTVAELVANIPDDGRIVIDVAAKRYYYKRTISVPKNNVVRDGKLLDIGIGFFARTRLYELMFEAPNESFELYLDDFQTFADSFQIESSQVWTPPEPASRKSKSAAAPATRPEDASPLPPASRQVADDDEEPDLDEIRAGKAQLRFSAIGAGVSVLLAIGFAIYRGSKR